MKKIININMIRELGLDHLSPREQEEMVLEISDVIYEAIISRTIHSLSPQDKTELEYMLAHSPSAEEIGQFMYTKVPEIDKIAEEEIVSFKKIALDTFHATLAA